MRTSEKTGQSRGFVSQSLSSDKGGLQESSLLNASTALMVGQWAWRRLPKKASMFGLLAVGAYIGYRMLKKDKVESFVDKMKLH